MTARAEERQSPRLDFGNRTAPLMASNAHPSQTSQRIRVLHVVPSFYPAFVYGGPIHSVYSLCSALAENGCEVRVLTTDSNGLGRRLDVNPTSEVSMAGGFRVRYCQRDFRHSISLSLLQALPEALRWADVVHLTAVYNFPTLPVLTAARAAGKPLVWSPRGALQRWQGTRRAVSKRIWEACCAALASRTAVLHVTSEQEACESAARVTREMVMIPNGVDIPADPPHVPASGALRLLFLGRLDPKKGIENLLAACSRLPVPLQEWRLTIAGGGEAAYADSIRQRIEELKLESNVVMAGEVSGQAREDLFASADLCVVPSFTENFGMVVAEALARSVPVIASRGTPWKGLEDHACGLWTANDPESLVAAILKLRQASLREMGRRGREWMVREFSWPSIAERMLALYSNLLSSSSQRSGRKLH